MKKAHVIDLFCGAGGLSHGLYREGFNVQAGIDIDPYCKYPFETNNHSQFIQKDIRNITGDDLSKFFPKSAIKILVGCAPCQPFSTYTQGGKSKKDWGLLNHFSRLAKELEPDIISMENVPRLLNFSGGKIFGDFVKSLQSLGFCVKYQVLFSPDYGLPQKRKRLVLLASRLGDINLPKPTHLNQHISVKQAIAHLPAIASGQTHPSDPMHTSACLSSLNLKRIKISKQGGSWREWPEQLVADCHKKLQGKSYGSVYGRMKWDEPSPTITTQFYGFGNGRFGHPEQHRALSFREGAILQGFPDDYKFLLKSEKPACSVMGRLIGNAVPVHLGQAIAKSIKQHLKGRL